MSRSESCRPSDGDARSATARHADVVSGCAHVLERIESGTTALAQHYGPSAIGRACATVASVLAADGAGDSVEFLERGLVL